MECGRPDCDYDAARVADPRKNGQKEGGAGGRVGGRGVKGRKVGGGGSYGHKWVQTATEECGRAEKIKAAQKLVSKFTTFSARLEVVQTERTKAIGQIES